MDNAKISVIIPYTEDNNKLADTLSSLCRQKNFDSTAIQVLIIDTTEQVSCKNSTGDLSICKIISTKSAKNEAEVCNFAMQYLESDYVTVARCGDIFSEEYFYRCTKLLDDNEAISCINVKRFCINPVFTEKKASRFNRDKTFDNTPVILEDKPTFVNTEVCGTLFRTECFMLYRFNPELKYEYFQDFMLKFQLDYPEIINAGNVEYDYFMPLEDDFLYFIPSNYKEWYQQSMEEFLIPLAEYTKEKAGCITEFLQFYLMFAVSTRFLANMNNRNKRNMNSDELQEFLSSARKVLQYVDNNYVLNKNKLKTFDYSEEAAEMFYMLKYDITFDDMPVVNVEGKNEVYLNCNNVFIARLTDQRVGMHVIDYRNGNLIIDGSFRRVFDLREIDFFVKFNNEKFPLVNNDRYSLTKYFGISAYKKFTFHLELPLDYSKERQSRYGVLAIEVE